MWQIKAFEGHNDLLISVCLDLVSMHIYKKYEGSMISHVDRRGNYNKKKENDYHLKNISHVD